MVSVVLLWVCLLAVVDILDVLVYVSIGDLSLCRYHLVNIVRQGLLDVLSSGLMILCESLGALVIQTKLAGNA